jgi:hypothetical protein
VSSAIKRLVLDVLKSHNPSIITVSQRLSVLKGVSGVNCSLEEVDQDTENIKITIEGKKISFKSVEKVIKACGGAVHSIDSVSTGEKLVEEVDTPQDK